MRPNVSPRPYAAGTASRMRTKPWIWTARLLHFAAMRKKRMKLRNGGCGRSGGGFLARRRQGHAGLARQHGQSSSSIRPHEMSILRLK